MRGLLLVVLGATLLWLILSKLRPVEAGEGEPLESAGNGTQLANGEVPVIPEPAQFMSRPGSRNTEPSVDVAQETAVPETRASEFEPELQLAQPAKEEPLQDSDPATYAADWSSEQELGLAAQLLHDPAPMGSWLQQHGRGLSEGRRRLVLALAACIVGDRGRAKSFSEGLEDARDVLTEERQLLQTALSSMGPREVRTRPASVNRESYVAHAASMALLAVKARADLQAGDSKAAAQAYSMLILEELDAAWAADSQTLSTWSSELHRAQEGWRWNPNADWPSIEVVVQPGDHLTRIRKRVLEARPDLLLCTGLIERANGIQGKVIHPDDVLKVPLERAHTLVDLSARWLLYMLGDEVVGAWQVGIGKPGHETRLGEFIAGEKETEPMWFRPGKDPVPFGDPENPLGTRWVAWMTPDGKKSSLGFHGTNEPESMGRAVSEGCIRMRNREVEVLFEVLPRDSRVIVRP